MIDTQTWVKSFRVGGLQVRLTLLKHTYAPGHGVRWVLQTSTALDR